MGQTEGKEVKIRAFGKKHHIRALSVPDVALGDGCKADDALEVLVAFDPDHLPGPVRLAGMQQELGEILGCTITLQTAQDLSRYYQQQHLDALDSEEGPYAKGVRGPWLYFR
jgi:predicted nucleotidyltransferase